MAPQYSGKHAIDNPMVFALADSDALQIYLQISLQIALKMFLKISVKSFLKVSLRFVVTISFEFLFLRGFSNFPRCF